jgi:hypothetical protein
MKMSGQFHAPAALPPGKEPLVSIECGVWLGPTVRTLWRKVKHHSPFETQTPIPRLSSLSLYKLVSSLLND